MTTQINSKQKQNFISGAMTLMLSMILVKIIGAIFKIPLTAIIKESGMAYFNAAYTLYTTVYAMTVTGLSAGVARMVAENVSMQRYRDVKKILKISTLVFVALGFLGMIFILIFSRTFTDMIKNPNAFYAVLAVAPAILFCCMMASFRGYYEGLSDMRPTAITQIVEVLIKLIAGLGIALAMLGYAQGTFESTGMVFGVQVATLEEATVEAIPYAAAGAMAGTTISTLIGFIYIFLRYKKKGDYITADMLRNSPKSRRGLVILVRLIKISIPITLGAVVLQLSTVIDMVTITNQLQSSYDRVPEYFDELYGALLMPNEDMSVFIYGCFMTAVTVFNLVPAFTNTFGKSALPNVTAAYTDNNKTQLRKNIESIVRVTMLIAAPAGMGLTFLATPIMTFLYPTAQGAIDIGGELLAVLGIGSIFLALMTPLNAILQGLGRVDLPAKLLFLGASIKLVFNLILVSIPTVNIMGGAVSTLLCYSTISIISLFMMGRISGLKLNIKNIIFKPVIAGLCCGVTASLVYHMLESLITNRILTLLSIGFGGIIYVIMLIILNAIAIDDVIMLPKGKNIAKTLAKYKIIR